MSGRKYQKPRPKATYAPWNVDTSFESIYQQVKGNTLVDKYRCYELWQLVKQSKDIPGALIEVGVWRGGSAALIAKSARTVGVVNTLYLCDTFCGVVKTSAKDAYYRGGEHADTSPDTVKKLLNHHELLEGVTILEGIFPDDTSQYIAEPAFRFCHIDVDVYESARGVMTWVWDRLSPGGIVVFDDYGFEGCDGVTKYVNEQIGLADRITIHNLNGHAVVIKRG